MSYPKTVLVFHSAKAHRSPICNFTWRKLTVRTYRIYIHLRITKWESSSVCGLSSPGETVKKISSQKLYEDDLAIWLVQVKSVRVGISGCHVGIKNKTSVSPTVTLYRHTLVYTSWVGWGCEELRSMPPPHRPTGWSDMPFTRHWQRHKRVSPT